MRISGWIVVALGLGGSPALGKGWPLPAETEIPDDYATLLCPKSTLAAELVTMLNAVQPGSTAPVPMDGFHMKHAKLEAMGQTDRKGASHTVEGADFVNFLHHLKAATGPVSGPGYSRRIEDAVDDAFTVQPALRILIVEGNYLLLTEGPRAGIRPQLDDSVFIDVPRGLVRARLLKRHGEEGLFTEERNHAHVERNDVPDFDLAALSQDRADVVITMDVER